jgi:hypothetical protein
MGDLSTIMTDEAEPLPALIDVLRRDMSSRYDHNLLHMQPWSLGTFDCTTACILIIVSGVKVTTKHQMEVMKRWLALMKTWTVQEL